MNEPVVRLMELVLAGRPEPLTSAFLSMLTDEERDAYRTVEETLVRLALAVAPPVQPSDGLRARILGSVEGRRRQTSRPALVVIDMIRDHLTEGAALEVPRARAIVSALAAEIAEARAKSIPIVYVVDEHPPDDPDTDAGAWGPHAIAGSGGNDIWPELLPAPQDRVVMKSTYSAFTGSALEAALDELACDSLVLTGCLTEIGIMATATDALQRGYAVTVPVATQAGLSAMTEQATLGILNIMPPFGPARQRLLARLGRDDAGERAGAR